MSTPKQKYIDSVKEKTLEISQKMKPTLELTPKPAAPDFKPRKRGDKYA